MSSLAGVSHREVALPQGTLRYREMGRGQPLVFIHGLLVNGDLWRRVAPPLARTYRCLIPDLPLGAHRVAMRREADLSPPGLARLITDFLTSLDLHEVTLVASDTGGALTQILLADHPERVARVVLTNCDTFENFLPPSFRYLTWASRAPGFVRLSALLLRSDMLRRLPLAYGRLSKRPVPSDVLAGYVHHLSRDEGIRRDLGKVLRGISNRYTLDAAERLHTFGGRSLVVWGSDDPVFPVADGRRLARSLRAAFTELPDAYAFVPEDQPSLLVEAVREFIGRSDRRRRIGAAGESRG